MGQRQEVSAEDHFAGMGGDDEAPDVAAAVAAAEDDLDLEDDEDEDEEDEEPEAEDDDSDEEDEDEDEDGEEDELILGRFKSADDLAKSYDHLERMHSSKVNELTTQLTQLQAAMQQQAILQQQAAAQARPAFGFGDPNNMDELIQLAAQDPDRAFDFAVNHQQRDELLPLVIGTQSHIGNAAAAEKLRLKYAQHQQAEQHQFFQTQQRELTQMKAQAAVDQAWASFITEYPEADELKGQMFQELASVPGLVPNEPDVAKIRTGFEKAMRLVVGAQKLGVEQAGAAAKAKSKTAKQRATAETGTHKGRGGARTPKAETAYGNDLVAMSKAHRYQSKMAGTV